MSRTLTPAQKTTRTIINTYGPHFYSEIGQLGGQTVVEKYGRNYMSLLGTLANDISARRRKRVEAALENILTASNN